MSNKHKPTSAIDPKKVLAKANEILHAGEAAEPTSDDTKALLYIGVHIIAAIDRNTHAINRNTAAIKLIAGDTLEAEDFGEAAEAAARAQGEV